MTETATENLKDQIFVRLLPHNPRKGRLVQRYSHWDGQLFEGGPRPTWYRVTREQAAELEPLRQEGMEFNDPDAKQLFQVVTGEEKQQIEAEEQGLALQALGAAAATVAANNPTTEDVRPEPAPAGGRSAALPPPKEGGEISTANVVPKSRRRRGGR